MDLDAVDLLDLTTIEGESSTSGTLVFLRPLLRTLEEVATSPSSVVEDKSLSGIGIADRAWAVLSASVSRRLPALDFLEASLVRTVDKSDLLPEIFFSGKAAANPVRTKTTLSYLLRSGDA